MAVIHTIELDINKTGHRIDQKVHVRVGDAGSQQIRCNLTQSGTAYTPPTGSTAKLEILKSDNTWSVSSASISGAQARATLPVNGISTPGECKRAYFRIINGNIEDTTEDFYLYIYPNATQDAIEASNYSDEFEKLLENSSAELAQMVTESRGVETQGADYYASGSHTLYAADIVQGTFNNSGGYQASTTRIRASILYPAKAGQVVHFAPGTTTTHVAINCFGYDFTKLATVSFLTGEQDIVLPHDGYIGIVFRNQESTAITPSQYDASFSLTSPTHDTVNSIKTELLAESNIDALASSGVMTLQTRDIRQGSFSSTMEPTTETNRICASRLIPLGEGLKVDFDTGSTSLMFAMLRYTYAGEYWSEPRWRSGTFSYTAPSDQAEGYMALAFRKQDNSAITPSDFIGVTVTVSSPIQWQITGRRTYEYEGRKVNFLRNTFDTAPLHNIETPLNDHSLQDFDVHNGIWFQSYDGGTMRTMNLSDGTVISTFPLGSQVDYPTQHCGNIVFGKEYFTDNLNCPALYVSGVGGNENSSSKHVFVESVTQDSATLKQVITLEHYEGMPFGSSIAPNADTDRLVFVGRKYLAGTSQAAATASNDIIAVEYKLPGLDDGTEGVGGVLEVTLTEQDVIRTVNVGWNWISLYQSVSFINGYTVIPYGLSVPPRGILVLDYDYVRQAEFSLDETYVWGEPQGCAVDDISLLVALSNGRLRRLLVK